MDQSSEREMREIMEEMAEDLGHRPDRVRNFHPRNASGGLRGLGQFLLPVGMGIVILVLGIALFFRNRGGVSEEEIQEMKTKIDRVEKKMSEIRVPQKTILDLEGKIAGLGQTVSRLDRSLNDVKDQAGRLNQMMSSLEKKASSPAVPDKTPPDLKKRATSPVKGSSYHIVQRGDTLYRIAKTYGLSLDELIRINRFTRDQAIQPGQKILVSPKAP